MINKEEIYTSYRDKVFGYLYHAIGNNAEAEDLCSTVFLKVYSKLDSFDSSKSALSTWIYNITKNTLYDYYRTRHVGLELKEDILCDDLDESSTHEEELEILAQALTRLNDSERTVVYDKYYLRHSFIEIAEKMNTPYFRVRTLHKSALKKIEDYFKKQENSY